MTPFMIAEDLVGATATTVGSLLSGRSDAMVILVLSLLIFGFWLWKIHLPRQESERQLRLADKAIHETNAQTLAELGKVTAGVHLTTVDSHKMSRAMVDVKQIELDLIKIVSDATVVAEITRGDVRERIAMARGVLLGVTHGNEDSPKK